MSLPEKRIGNISTSLKETRECSECRQGRGFAVLTRSYDFSIPKRTSAPNICTLKARWLRRRFSFGCNRGIMDRFLRLDAAYVQQPTTISLEGC